jgi:[ribosomal protein S5]-alanine N-acetyltransferase
MEFCMHIIETGRLLLMALDREHLALCLTDLPRLEADYDLKIAKDVFSDETRQAIGIKTTRMLLVDTELHPWYTYFLIMRKEDRRVMGVCGFKGAPTALGSVELGYSIHPDFRNQGYMTEAVVALVDWAFKHDECSRIIAETLKDNLPSQRVLQKAGLKRDQAVQNMIYWTIEKPVHS